MQSLSTRVTGCFAALKAMTEGETANKKENKALEEVKKELLSIGAQLTTLEVLCDKLQAMSTVLADSMYLETNELTETQQYALCLEHKRNGDLFGILNDYIIQSAEVLNGEG